MDIQAEIEKLEQLKAGWVSAYMRTVVEEYALVIETLGKKEIIDTKRDYIVWRNLAAGIVALRGETKVKYDTDKKDFQVRNSVIVYVPSSSYSFDFAKSPRVCNIVWANFGDVDTSSNIFIPGSWQDIFAIRLAEVKKIVENHEKIIQAERLNKLRADLMIGLKRIGTFDLYKE